MDSKPVLIEVARALREQRLEAILIGNAAAALQGAPVSTIDLDFLIRKTQANITKLEKLADALGAIVYRQHYPVSNRFRLMRDDDFLQLDFTADTGSFDALRPHVVEIPLRAEPLTGVARLSMSSNKRSVKKKALETLKRESELALEDQIRRLLAKPMSERTHFLRKRIGIASSAL